MNKEEMLARITVLRGEIDARAKALSDEMRAKAVANRMNQEEIRVLYAEIDSMKEPK